MANKINEKLGLKSAGKRSMMQLPDTRAAAAALTSAKCPKCGQRGARLSRTQAGSYWCSQADCGETWAPSARA